MKTMLEISHLIFLRAKAKVAAGLPCHWDSVWRWNMKSKLLTFLVMAIGFHMVSNRMLAHHGSSAYDSTNPLTMKGTVTDFQFINPHVIVKVAAKDDKGNVQE